jgi:hypothetical protein
VEFVENLLRLKLECSLITQLFHQLTRNYPNVHIVDILEAVKRNNFNDSQEEIDEVVVVPLDSQSL